MSEEDIENAQKEWEKKLYSRGVNLLRVFFIFLIFFIIFIVILEVI